jgi:hypothetical protein
MQGASAPILVAVVIQLALGGAVFQANPRRKANQCFLLLSFAIAVWLAALYWAFSATTEIAAVWAIREASAAGPLIFISLNLLRISIRDRSETWSALARAGMFSIVAGLAAVAFCQTDFFVYGARFADAAASGGGIKPPEAVYGSGFPLYALYFAGATAALLFNYIRDVRATTGAEHAELSFILIGEVTALIVSVLLAVGVRYLLAPAQVVWFAPVRIVLFSLVIAYGIATRKLMDVGFFLRRAMSYTVLTAYLLVLYALVWWLVGTAFSSILLQGARAFAHVAAAIAGRVCDGTGARPFTDVRRSAVHQQPSPRLPLHDERSGCDLEIGHDVRRPAGAFRQDDHEGSRLRACLHSVVGSPSLRAEISCARRERGAAGARQPDPKVSGGHFGAARSGRTAPRAVYRRAGISQSRDAETRRRGRDGNLRAR